MSHDETTQLFDSLFSILQSTARQHNIKQPDEDDRFWLAVRLHDYGYAIDDAEAMRAHYDDPPQTDEEKFLSLSAAHSQHLNMQSWYEQHHSARYKGNGVPKVEWKGEKLRAGNCMCSVAIQAQHADYRPRWKRELDEKRRKEREKKQNEKLRTFFSARSVADHIYSEDDNDLPF